MWLRRATNYLLEHRWQTIALVFLLTFVPVIGTLGIVIAAFITLRKGLLAGIILTLAATLPYIAVYYMYTNQHVPSAAIAIWAAIGVAFISNLLTWVFASMLYKEANWSTVLQVAALFGVLVVSIIHLIYPNIAEWWSVQLHSYYPQVAAGMPNTQQKLTEAQIEAIDVTKQFATGVMVAAILFSALLQVIVARWWETVVFYPRQLRRELHNIRLSHLAGILFAISLVLSYLGNSVVLDIMPILYLLFISAGLSLIHYLFGAANITMKWFWLLVMYMVLIFSLPVSLVLVSGVALIDTAFNIRRRVKKFKA